MQKVLAVDHNKPGVKWNKSGGLPQRYFGTIKNGISEDVHIRVSIVLTVGNNILKKGEFSLWAPIDLNHISIIC